jgi:O-antigen/teichoic acid export membrane protein
LKLLKIFNSAVLNTWFNSFANTFGYLVVLPLVITKLSVEEISVWLLLSTVVAISQGVLFGFNTTFSRFIAYVNNGVKIKQFIDIKSIKQKRSSSELDLQELSRVYLLMRNVYFILSLIYFFILLILGYFILKKPMSFLANPTEGWLSFLVILLATTTCLAFGYYQNFMIGINRVALVQRVSGIVHLVGIVFIILVLTYSPNLFSVVIVLQLITLTSVFFIAYFARKNLTILGLNVCKNTFDNELFKIVWSFSWKSGFTSVIASIIKHISGIIIAQLFVPSTVANFLFTQKIFNIIERFTSSTFVARLPVFAALRGNGDFVRLLPFLRQSQYLAFLVFFAGYIALLIFGEYLLSFIKSNVNLAASHIIVLFSFATFLSRWGGMTLNISNQANIVLEHISVMIYFLSLFLLNIILFQFYQSISVFLFSQIIGVFLSIFFVRKVLYSSLFTTFMRYERSVLLPATLVLVSINIIYFYSEI